MRRNHQGGWVWITNYVNAGPKDSRTLKNKWKCFGKKWWPATPGAADNSSHLVSKKLPVNLQHGCHKWPFKKIYFTKAIEKISSCLKTVQEKYKRIWSEYNLH